MPYISISWTPKVPLCFIQMLTVLGGCKWKLMFCVSNVLSLVYISTNHLFGLTHLLSIVNSTSSSSFPCKIKWMQSLQVDSPVKIDTLQESVLFKRLYKSASTFSFWACNRFGFLNLLSAILLVPHVDSLHAQSSSLSFVIASPWDFLPPSQVLVQLLLSCQPLVWALGKIQLRDGLSKTGIKSIQHSLK